MTINENRFEQTSLQKTTCAYCGVGCGIDIEHVAGVPTGLSGTPEHPANYGRLCVKGTHLLTTTNMDNRLLYPEVNNQQTSWQTAISHVASKFSDIIEQHGPDSVAFYVSGQLLTEDYYVANKLMKGYIGSGNIDTNSRLCMSSAVSAYKRAFGEDVVPCNYDDIENTDLMVFIGSNAAWTHPVLFQRLERAQKANPNLKIVVIDPRKTTTAESADLYLPIKPGTDAALYNGLLKYISDEGFAVADYIEQHTEQFETTLTTANNWTVEKVSSYCELDKESVKRFYQLFCKNNKVLSFYSMGINQSTSGVDKCNAIINVHLATQKIARSGCGPFSITGQPNAMGGREVGGMANQLTAHLDIENEKHTSLVQRFWKSPKIATKSGVKAVDLFDEMLTGKIKAVWIMATNPMVSMPDTSKIEQALKQCEFVVVSDCVAKNDTLAFADVKLPATSWIEKNGTVTNSERRISRQRSVMEAPGLAQHDWRIICDVANAMGFKDFAYSHPVDIFREYAQLTAFENNERQLNLSALSQISEQEYDAFQPTQWPIKTDQNSHTRRVFSDHQFSTPTKKAQFIPITPRLPKSHTSVEFPITLNSGRIRDQWHTMTRTGKSPLLNRHIEQPFISLNDSDAKAQNLTSGQLVNIESSSGKVTLKTIIDTSISKGQAFAPIHWNKQFASSANVNQLYAGYQDPISGQPETKQTSIKLAAATYSNYMQLYVSDLIVEDSLNAILIADFWVKSKMTECTFFDIAISETSNDTLDPLLWCQLLEFKEIDTNKRLEGEWIQLSDSENLTSHILCISNGIIKFAAYCSKTPIKRNYRWVDELLGKPLPEFKEIQSLLHGEVAEGGVNENDKTICSCFNVKQSTIEQTIENTENCSVESLGKRLKCGTNCGSCKPELKKLILNKKLQVEERSSTKEKRSNTLLEQEIIPVVTLSTENEDM